MEKWFVAAKKADFNAWAHKLHISPITARIIRNREILSEEDAYKFLNGSLDDLYSPWLMKDMDKAADLILGKIHKRSKIRVIGDYDVDGICAAHILTQGLRNLGANVDTAIPHRIKDGYGLNEQLILCAHEDGVDTIITCDNGIAAAEQVEQAHVLGMTVVVTDHHEVPFEETQEGRKEILPPAAAVIDPKRADCTYPFKGICGGVVAYKLIQALKEKAIQGEDSQLPASVHKKEDMQESIMDELLQFAALATVCDVMELLEENRIIVKEGLRRMRTKPSLGIKALLEVNGIEPLNLSAYHLGFVIGPCINASGRLDTALRALELLGCTERREAVTAAGELKELNDSRKAMTQKGIEEAIAYLEENSLTQDKVLLVYLPDCHESLAGIIAGRIREKYSRPTFVLTKGEEGIKGSGRSIEAYHMYEAMNACKELFTKYGGHKMAAGLSMEEENIEALRSKLNGQCSLTEEEFMPRVHIDIPVPLSMADKKLAEELSVLEPFGVGNTKPLFARKNVCFISGRLLGAKGNCARYTVTEEEQYYELVFFGDLQQFHACIDEWYGVGTSDKLYVQKCSLLLSITYQLGINSYRGKESVQLIMQNYCQANAK